MRDEAAYRKTRDPVLDVRTQEGPVWRKGSRGKLDKPWHQSMRYGWLVGGVDGGGVWAVWHSMAFWKRFDDDDDDAREEEQVEKRQVSR